MSNQSYTQTQKFLLPNSNFNVLRSYAKDKITNKRIPVIAHRVVNPDLYKFIYETKSNSRFLDTYKNNLNSDNIDILTDNLQNELNKHQSTNQPNKRALEQARITELIKIIGKQFHCESILYVKGYHDNKVSFVRLPDAVEHGLVLDGIYEKRAREFFYMDIKDTAAEILTENRTSGLMASNCDMSTKQGCFAHLTLSKAHPDECNIGIDYLPTNQYIERWYTGIIDNLSTNEPKDKRKEFDGALNFGTSTQLLYRFGIYVMQFQRNKVRVDDKIDEILFYDFEASIIDQLVELTFQSLEDIYATRQLILPPGMPTTFIDDETGKQIKLIEESATQKIETPLAIPLSEEETQQTEMRSLENIINGLREELNEIKGDSDFYETIIKPVVELRKEKDQLKGKTDELEKEKEDLKKKTLELEEEMEKEITNKITNDVFSKITNALGITKK